MTRYLFTSREFDEQVGLQYSRARWYDMAVGRWVSQDPLGFTAGDWNIARYVGNSVTTFVDPTGLEAGTVIWEAVTGLGDGIVMASMNAVDFVNGIAEPIATQLPGMNVVYRPIIKPMSDHVLSELHEYKADLIQEHGGLYVVSDWLSWGSIQLIGFVAMARIMPAMCFIAGTPVVVSAGNNAERLTDCHRKRDITWTVIGALTATVAYQEWRIRRKTRRRHNLTPAYGSLQATLFEATEDDQREPRYGSSMESRFGVQSPLTNEAHAEPTNHVDTRLTRLRRTFTSHRSRLTLCICLIMIAALLGFKAWHSLGLTTVPRKLTASSNAQIRPDTKTIEDLEVGTRVTGRNPFRNRIAPDASEPNPETWRKLVLLMNKQDGVPVLIELLRPLAWIEEAGASPQNSFVLDLPELGVAGDAFVVAIESCPPIKPGRGNVITGTFHHEAGSDTEILRVEFSNGAVINGVTNNHPFWSVNHSEFVAIGDLREGDRVSCIDGTTRIVRIESRLARPGEMLHNLEVHSEHVYQVTAAGILVHNNCADILMPGGKPIGVPGSRPTIRQVPGGAQAAQNLFDDLAKGGKDITPPGYPGTLIQVPKGGVIGFRPSSKSGPPTIDINIPGIPIDKIKFL